MLNTRRFILELVQAKTLSVANGKKLLVNLEQQQELHNLQHALFVCEIPELQRYSILLDPDHPLLKDHLIQGEKILLGAAHLDCVISAFQHLFRLEHDLNNLVVIEDMVWLAPVLVEETPVRLAISFEHKFNARIEFNIKLDSGSDNSKEEKTFSQGNIYLADPYPASKVIKNIRVPSPQLIMSGSECYAIFSNNQLHYGDSLKGISHIYKNKNCVIADINCPSEILGALTEFTVHPALLDYGFQACIAYQHASSGIKLPFALTRFRYTGIKQKLTAILCDRDPGTDKIAITLLSEDGQPIVIMEGLASRAISGVADSTHLYSSVWIDFHPSEPSPPHQLELLHAQVIFVGLDEEYETNKATLKSVGYSVDKIAIQKHVDVATQYIHIVKQLIQQLKTPAGAKEKSGYILQVIMPSELMDGPFIGLSALLKTAELEMVGLKTQLIGIGESASQSLSKTIYDLGQDPRAHTIKVETNLFWSRELQPYKNPAQYNVSQALPDGVYLITGGAGGLGKIFVRELSQQGGNKTVIILGRKNAGDWFNNEFSSCQNLFLEYIATDITDRESTFKTIETVKQRYGKISAVIHASGIIHDDLIINKGDLEVDQVLAPKALGIQNIDDATANEKLDLFIAFSSVAGYFGNLGQSDYAAANGYLDGFMRARARKVACGERYGKSLSIAWPLWQDGGMHVDAASLAMLERRGLSLLDTSTGIKQFHIACASDAHYLLSLVGDVRRMHQHRQTADSIKKISAVTLPGATENNLLHQSSVNYFKGLLSDITRLSVDRIEANVLFEEYGIDSIKVMKMTNDLEQVFGLLPKTLFFEKQNINELAEFFVSKYPEKMGSIVSPPRSESVGQVIGNIGQATHKSHSDVGTGDLLDHHSETGIAIIGLAGRYPGSRDLDAFWDNLCEGKDCIKEIPEDRWNNSLFYEKNRFKTGKIHSQWGGFIEGVYEFDPLFFNISPKEAKFLDPQERLFLQCAYHTLEDAGYTAETLGHSVGVYVGVMYEEHQLYGEIKPENSFALSGNLSSIPNRVSHFFNFQGPSLAIDTMCSSSLTALHLAVESLKRKECNYTIVGGVNLSLHPNKYFLLSQGQFISSRGHCESFGEGGDGYIPGEGVGAVLLKPLSTAKAAGDHIYGVIKATAINHGGKANGFTVPNPRAQADVIVKALRDSGVNPESVSYIEAHGTGTVLGDPIEIAGLTQAFSTTRKQYCSIGSVKSNIGHCESAAGIAALTKVLLQMEHKTLVPSLHSTTLNPNIDFSATPFYVQQSTEPWITVPESAVSATHPKERIAGISSFGAGGSNAHIIVAADKESPWSSLPKSPYIIVLSAKRKIQLNELVKRYLDLLATDSGNLTDSLLPHIAFTLQQGRNHFDERLAIVVENLTEMKAELEGFLAERKSPACYYGAIKPSGEDLLEQQIIDISVDRWLSQKAFHKIAEAWCKGWMVPWGKVTSSIFHGVVPRRISLPKMPFAAEVYQIAKIARGFTDEVGQFTASAKLNPLLHRNVSILNQQRFNTTFSGTEFVVSDHLVQGHQVLPGVAYLEMAYQALRHSFEKNTLEGKLVVLKQVVWLRPCVIHKALGALSTAIQQDDQKQFHFSITSEDVRANNTLYCKGKIVLENAAVKAGVDISALKNNLVAQNKNINDIYKKFRESGIEYGPAYQCITEIYASKYAVLAKLELAPQFAVHAADFYLNPGILDAATQASVYLEQSQTQNMAYFVEEVTIYDACQSHMWAYLTEDEASTSNTKKINIDVINEAGVVCVSLKALSFRNMSLEEPRFPVAAKDKDAECLVPLWRPVHEWFNREDYLAQGDDRCLVVSFDDNELFSEDPACGEIHHLRLYEYQSRELVANTIDALGMNSVDKVVLNLPVFQSLDAQIESHFYQEKGLAFTLLNLVKILIEFIRTGSPLNWLVVTRQEYKIFADEKGKTASGLIQGLLGTAIKEHPNWSLACLDINQNRSMEPWEIYIRNHNKKEICLAERDGVWFERCYFPARLTHEETTSFRHQGTYVLVGGAGAVGRALTHYLQKNYDTLVIWLGRRPLDQALQGVDQFNVSRLAYYQCDASVAGEFESTIREITSTYGKIHGVFHAAVDLHSRNIKSLQAEEFIAALASKVDVSINIAKAFKGADLDFLLFFSSITTFIRTQGQAAYASACNYLEEFSDAIRDQYGLPAKVVNLGYWGGEIFDNAKEMEGLRLWLDRIGMATLDPRHALAQIDKVLSGPYNQVSLLKTEKKDIFNDIAVEPSKQIQLARDIAVHLSVLEEAQVQVDFLHINPEEEAQSVRELGHCLDALIDAILREPVVAQQKFSPASWQYKWLNASRQFLHGTPISKPLDYSSALASWHDKKNRWLKRVHLKNQVALIDNVLSCLLDVLLGKISAAEILFRSGKEEDLVNVYKNTPLLSYHNAILANSLGKFIEAYVAKNNRQKIRVLEIGAGTGSTTGFVLDALKPFAADMDVYEYTDISKFFLQRGKKAFLTENTFMNFSLLDIEKDIAGQGFSLGSYDIVIASNVIHATSRINSAIGHIKQLLKHNGLLLLNEISTHSLMSHMTFGLTEGWWRFKDGHLRIPGGPGLSYERWNSLLKGAGFHDVRRLTRLEREYGQQVIAAQSDGIFMVDDLTSHTINIGAAASHTEPGREIHQQALFAQQAVDVKAVLLASLSEALDIKVEDINVKTAFSDYGLDSIIGVGLTENLNGKLGIQLNPTDLFDYSNADELTSYIEKQFAGTLTRNAIAISTAPQLVSVEPKSSNIFQDKIKTAASYPLSAEDYAIAVIGMSGQFPGASNIDEFWENIINQKDVIQDITTHKKRDFFLGSELVNAGALYAGILENRDNFDPIFFNLSPREAEEMSPHQRLVMQEGWGAIENAGYDPLSFSNGRVGIFVGAEPSGYQSASFTGGSEAIIASRLSYFLNTRGPALVVNTGCSSSAVAIHLACESLRKNESDLALAGGVFASITAPGLQRLMDIGMLSSSGQCRPFDAHADGTVLSEAASFVFLKSLTAAKRDNDVIYGVIHNSAMNQDGFSNGITAPNGKAQEDLIVQLYQNSSVDIHQLDYIEAHGTGTVLGDPIEVNALTRALARTLPKAKRVHLGSLKSHIGHTSAAAGVSALIKIMLCLKHETLPGLKNFNQINPNIRQDNSNLVIQESTREWKRKEETYRLAGFSSFGHGGTNVHMLVGEEII